MVHSTRLVQSNWGFALLNFAIWYWNTFLNKCGFVIHHFIVHFSLYFLLVMTYYLLCILYLFIQKSKFEWFSYSSSKWVIKQQRQLATICKQLANNTFDPGIANERTVQWCFKKFCKGDEFLEDEECSGWPSQVDNNQLSAIIEMDPLTTIWEVSKELNCGPFYGC